MKMAEALCFSHFFTIKIPVGKLPCAAISAK